MPCTLTLPAAERRISSAEAGLFCAAVSLAAAVTAGDSETLAALDADLMGVLWATVTLVIILTAAFIDQSDWLDPAAAPDPARLWDTIPATLARWESYGPEAGLANPQLRDCCSSAVALIKRVHQGDGAAFARTTSPETVARLLAGAMWILAAVTQWPVQSELAATPDQVRAELLDAITRWRSQPDPSFHSDREGR